MKACVILAAGEGRRLGVRKQFLEVKGKPLFMFSVEKALRIFDEVIVTLPEDVLQKIALPEGVKRVAGGKERQDSVLNAILETEAEIVVVHDSARPLATEEMFRKVASLGSYDGKIVAVPSRDTLKEVTGDTVIRTVDRSNIWLSRIGIVQGSFWNIKVTYREDLYLLEKLLSDCGGGVG